MSSAPEKSKLWWQEAAIYQIYPRSFQDSNGDGEGDLPGVISRLPYLKELGVDAIWLSPFYSSPNKDGGYDVSNPRDVDPRFGKMSDAVSLIDEAHKVGLRVIVDIVPNHFSIEHVWFKSALDSKPGSKERSRFHFYDGRGKDGAIPPNNWCSIFGGPAWSRVTESDGRPGQWYLHLFDSTQADLNWANQDVHDDFEKTLRFWLDKGVDGFRIDVAHGLVKDEILHDHRDPEGLTRALRLDVSDMPREQRESLLSDVPFFDRDGVHEIYRKWRGIFDSYSGERMSVAEAWVHPSSRATLYVRPDELHQIFNFDFLIAEWDANFLSTAVEKTLQEVAAVSAPPTWVLSNHDSPRLVSRMGGGETGERKARAIALLTHALPGGVYVFQGEELGLPDAPLRDEDRQDPVFFRTKGIDKGRDGARVPLPWNSSGNNYGFTSGKPWLPIPDNWSNKTVEEQKSFTTENNLSFLQLYRKSLRLRKDFADSDFSWLIRTNEVIGFTRGKDFAIYSNTSERTVQMALPESFSASEIMLSSAPEIQLLDADGTSLLLPPHSTTWVRRLK